MFRMRLTRRTTRIDRLRNLFGPAVKNLEGRIQTNVRPKIEADVKALLATYPGQVRYPFQFTSALSRKFYFANFKPPYSRTMSLFDAWFVAVSNPNGLLSAISNFVFRRHTAGTLEITIGNTSPYFGYVYDPAQVPGHAATGWGDEADTAQVLARAIDYVVQEWGPSIVEVIED